MNEYSIKLPNTTDRLFDHMGVRKNSIACVSSSIASPTNHTTKVTSVSGNKIHVAIHTPRGDHSKTVSVERSVRGNTLVLDVLYYGSIDVHQARALSQCARKYGCSRIAFGADVLNDISKW